MLLLLPPSETKRPGGTGAPWAAGRLALPALDARRAQARDALVALSADPEVAARVLKLGPKQRGEIEVNAALRGAPTMPAVDRYTGVLYDALSAPTRGAEARRWLGDHVLIHSAPFGPVGALDPLPAYRLGASASVPGLPPLRRLWADAVTAALAEVGPPFIVDLRSEAYVGLGPVPPGVPSVFVRVVADGPGGTTRALNHFNKHAKGALVRELADEQPAPGSLGELLEWLRGRGHRVEETPGEWLLFEAPRAP
ncbi:YaaA family protein [Microbacterium sp. cx-59]|uniref:YaaA family protein n=1 Tax=Microbacterium sp. cx-59 TaxID=2891207 RepID=UPI001E62BCFD|nr:peroxide stress protein YaaA [Microbacterium sp. cx-59]MCC4909670.1 peroxide stress protein YaaA [Microbacterium sp. cx-59]